jgi:hypothetical protein
VNADIRNVDAICGVGPHVSPMGAKGGLGEIPIIGSAAAVANAVYDATGIRVRALPIAAEKLMMPRQSSYSTVAPNDSSRVSAILEPDSRPLWS